MPREPKTTKTARTPTRRTRRTPARRAVTHDEIATRAYALYVSGAEGGPFEHWVRAERELTAA